jgi:hypothetical protein
MRHLWHAAMVVLLSASPVAAQTQTEVPVVVGYVNPSNGPDFLAYVASQSDTVIGLKVIIEPTAEGTNLAYSVHGEPSQSRISISHYDRSLQTGLELNADATWSSGWRLDGFYVPKFASMGQGLMAFFLQPVDEGAIRLNPSVRLQEIPADDLPEPAD